MKRGFREGDLFAVPLGDGRFGAGVISAGTRNVLCGHFFAPAYGALPGGRDLDGATAAQALFAARFFDEALHESRWPVLRPLPHFVRSAWPKPDGEPLEARFVEQAFAARLDGRDAARRVFAVRDLRASRSELSLGVGALSVQTRLQWREPMQPGDLAQIERLAASREDTWVRLYGSAGVQAPHLTAWPALHRLALDGAAATPSLPRFDAVAELALDGVPGDLAGTLARFPNVRALECDARGASFDCRALASLPKLERVSLIAARCENAEALAGIGSLRALSLRECDLAGSDALAGGAVGFVGPALRALRIASMPQIRSIETLRGHASLRTLALEGLTHLDDVAAIASLPALESLALTGVWHLRVDDVAFVTELPSLRRLEIDLGGRRKNVEIYRRRPLALPTVPVSP